MEGYRETFESVIVHSTVKFTPQPEFFNITTEWAAALQDIAIGSSGAEERLNQAGRRRADQADDGPDRIRSGGMAVKAVAETGRALPSTERVNVPRTRRYRPYLILLLLTAGILYPFGVAIYYSLTNFSFKYEKYSFVGLENWVDMFRDPGFWHSLWVTAKYALLSTGAEMVIGVGIALLLNRETRLARSLRVVLIFPLMIAPVIATLIWQLMINYSVGVIGHGLRRIGITDFTWAADPDTALFTVVLIDAWVYTPFVILLTLAGLRSLPKSPFESARIDGIGVVHLQKPDPSDDPALLADCPGFSPNGFSPGVLDHFRPDQRRSRRHVDDASPDGLYGRVHL